MHLFLLFSLLPVHASLPSICLILCYYDCCFAGTFASNTNQLQLILQMKEKPMFLKCSFHTVITAAVQNSIMSSNSLSHEI